MRKPGSEGLSARQRDAGKEEEAGAVAAKDIGFTSLSLPSRDAFGHAGSERGEEGEQEEREEDAAEEEQPVVVSEEVEEDDDDKE